MAREKGMGNLQREKSGRWTMRVGIDGKRYCRSTRTKDRDKAERFLQRFLAPFGLGEHRLPLADVWLEYVKSPNRNELARATLEAKRNTWLQFAKWMEQNYLPVDDLAGVTSEMIAEYLACIRMEVSATTYNNRVCVLREIFHTLAAKAGLEEDPWEGVRLRPDDSHSRRELTMGELRRLLEAARRYDGEQLEFRVGVGERNLATCATASLNGGGRERTPGAPQSQDNEIALENDCGAAGCPPSEASSAGGARGVRALPRNTEGGSVGLSPTPTPNSNSSSEWHTLFLIGIYTGLRLGDCCRLDWSSINMVQGIIQLIPRKTRRHAHGRPVTIPIHPALGAALLESRWTAELGDCAAEPLNGAAGVRALPIGQRNEVGDLSPTPTLDSNFFSGPVLPTISSLYERGSWRVAHGLKRIFTAAKITTSVKLEGRRHKTPEATFHSLRHTFVSFAANAGVPLHIVQSIVGHESTAMTRHYYHENIAALQSAVAAIPTV